LTTQSPTYPLDLRKAIFDLAAAGEREPSAFETWPAERSAAARTVAPRSADPDARVDGFMACVSDCRPQ
jgi:hypothetical protein